MSKGVPQPSLALGTSPRGHQSPGGPQMPRPFVPRRSSTSKYPRRKPSRTLPPSFLQGPTLISPPLEKAGRACVQNTSYSVVKTKSVLERLTDFSRLQETTHGVSHTHTTHTRTRAHAHTRTSWVPASFNPAFVTDLLTPSEKLSF